MQQNLPGSLLPISFDHRLRHDDHDRVNDCVPLEEFELNFLGMQRRG